MPVCDRIVRQYGGNLGTGVCDIGEGDARIEIRDDDSTIETRVDGEVEKKKGRIQVW